MKQKRLTVKLDPYTFGGSPASVGLAKILNEQHPELVAKVGARYHKFTAQLACCVSAAHLFPDGGMRTLIELYKQHQFASVRKAGMPDAVTSRLLNVLSTSYKMNLCIINRLMAEAAQKIINKTP